ncbi:methylthioribulose-1-phosphate dehydratase [Angomonas deanei]|uniref:Probable methylthioribulose-1-phosphate dehydratase n=1 Tax=Angomonas deanei TaxID=59799 RepID=S9VFZ0_9TRYP|nr:methylthioribulose 1-phosphate dehydratase [Angomonas deanei]EPY39894.1 methylthioribulose-1-phosphate dehydratase [Angomonas deanei]CAD2218836.1 Class II Aldolase and Adducin N-terminal domain containing protein, putative [Angomonas deanei]|eukprot:EPY39894.1 methylthioribulose-1-phosphate dehydratase [Angomonas deanei]
MTTLPLTHPEHPRNLIPELCRLFYQQGWATGTGGGISIKLGNTYYLAPSGVPKERIQPDDIFEVDKDQNVLVAPAPERNLKVSECTPLFFNAYRMRDAGACLHSHSQNVVLISMLCEKEFRISHIEMIKGIVNPETKKALGYRDTLRVPIIENVDFEKDLTASMAACMKENPHTNAVIVRRHGIYVWGATWQKAKGMVECLDYLMEVALKMRAAGLPWEVNDAEAELGGEKLIQKRPRQE